MTTKTKYKDTKRLRDTEILVYWGNLPERLRDVKTVAKIFKVSPRTLYRIVNGK